MKMKWLPAIVTVGVLCGSAAGAQTAPAVTFLGTFPMVVAQPPVAASAVSSFGVDAGGNYFYVDDTSGSLIRAGADGSRATLVTGLKGAAIAVDYKGDVFISDTGNNRVLSLAAGATTALTRAYTAAPTGIAADVSGGFFYVSGGVLYEIDRNGGPRKIASVPGAQLLAYGPANGEDDTLEILSASGSQYSISTYTYHNASGTLASGAHFTSADPVHSFVADAAGDAIFAAAAGAKTYLFQVSPSGQKEVLTQVPAGVRPALAVDYNRTLLYVDSTGVNQVMKGPVNFGLAYFDYRGNNEIQILLRFAVPPGITLARDTYTVDTKLPSAFEDYDGPPPGACSPGVTECDVVVTYQPGYAGVDTATMRLLDPSGATLVQVPLYGRGVSGFSHIFTTDAPVSQADPFVNFFGPPVPKLKAPAGISNFNDLLVTDPGTGSLLSLLGMLPPQTGLGQPQTVASYPSNGSYVTQSGMAGVLHVDADGVRSRIASRLATEPNGVAVDAAGNVYISDRSIIFRVGVDGTETQLATPATDGGYQGVVSLAVSAEGDAYAFFNSGGTGGAGGLVKITPAGIATPLALPPAVRSATGLALDDGGGLFFSDGIAHTLSTLRTDGSYYTLLTGLKQPKGVRGSDGPLVVDQGAGAVYGGDELVLNSMEFGNIEGNTTIDFGKVPVGSSVTKTYIVLSEGRGLGGVGVSPLGTSDFSYTNPNAEVPPGGASTLTVTYTPTAAGTTTEMFFISENEFGGNDVFTFVYLTGTGVVAGK